MPKVKRNSNLIRLARRQIPTSDNLSSAVTRKLSGQDGVLVQMKDSNANPPLESEKKNGNKKSGNGGTDCDQTQQLSRGRRKRQAKRERFLRKEKMILSSLLLKRQEEQKKRIDGLDGIKQALMDTEDTKRSAPFSDHDIKKPELKRISTIKAKRKLVANEIEHVNLILQHPSYKKDPFATMQEHLRNSFSEDRKYHDLLSRKRSETENQKLKAKRSEKKRH